MTYKLVKEREDGKLVRLSLGIPEVDAYLKFLQQRRPTKPTPTNNKGIALGSGTA